MAKRKSKKRTKKKVSPQIQIQLPDVDDSLDNVETDQSVIDSLPEDDVAGVAKTDEDGYLDVAPVLDSRDESAVVVGDYEAGGELAEPQKVLRTDMSRHQRKAEQRKNLDKS